MEVKLNLFDELAFVTVKINVQRSTSNSSGTGFFCSLMNDGEKSVPVLVTNKHVVEGGLAGQLVMLLADENGNPTSIQHTIQIKDFAKAWIMHPDPDIDLCVMPWAPIFEHFKASGKWIFYKTLTEQHFPPKDVFNDFDTVEEIIMVGYPNSIWDKYNNKPIFRRGITATSMKLNYDGNPNFLIDVATFPGSSGSPIFIANANGYGFRNDFYMGQRLFLVGVAFRVFHNTIKGEIIPVPINQLKLATVIGMPNHLGIAIRFDQLFVFNKLLGLPEKEW